MKSFLKPGMLQIYNALFSMRHKIRADLQKTNQPLIEPASPA